MSIRLCVNAQAARGAMGHRNASSPLIGRGMFCNELLQGDVDARLPATAAGLEMLDDSGRQPDAHPHFGGICFRAAPRCQQRLRAGRTEQPRQDLLRGARLREILRMPGGVISVGLTGLNFVCAHSVGSLWHWLYED